MKVWAWSRPGVSNFGDELGPAILSRMGVRVERVDLPGKADIISVGSVIQHADKFKGIIWGTGSLRSTDSADLSTADVRAVRGPKTRDRLNLSKNIPLGDPGILVPKLWPRSKTKYKLGWVPHYKDPRNIEADKVINLLDPVDDVIDQITSCGKIITSSLHGLIVAESFGIPTMHFSSKKVIGGSWKFDDYELAFHSSQLENAQNRLMDSITDIIPF